MYVLVYTHILEKATTTHSSTFACKIPRMGEPGRLQSMGSLRVRHAHELKFCLIRCQHIQKWSYFFVKNL